MTGARRGKRVITLIAWESISRTWWSSPVEECKLRREFHTAELLPIYGADYRMVYLRYDLAECPAHRKFNECEVRYRGT